MKLKTEFISLLEDIEQSIGVILLTRKGEKIFEPEFGCDIWELLDKGIDKIPLYIAAIYDALERWEKRISVEKIDVELIDVNSGNLLVKIEYEIKDTGDRYVYEREL
jgi:phage baseplate assembly protein W